MNNGCIKVSPSILSGDFAAMGESVRKCGEWGADWVHCDIMDGRFVPNITFGMPMIKAIRKCTDLSLDVHLMILEPEKYIPEFIECGADIVTFHPDVCGDVRGTLEYIRSKGRKGGVVVNPDKRADIVLPYLDLCDVILVMGVYPGFGGQKFIESTLTTMEECRRYIDESGRDIYLEVDGGVTVGNVRSMTSRGVNAVVGGSSVFGAADPAEAIAALRTL